MKEFGNRLKRLRVRNRLTQSELGDVLGVSNTAIMRYEKGQREPEFEKLISLSKIFKVSTDYLLGIDEVVENDTMYLSARTRMGIMDAIEIINTNPNLKGKIKTLRLTIYFIAYCRAQDIDYKDDFPVDRYEKFCRSIAEWIGFDLSLLPMGKGESGYLPAKEYHLVWGI